MNFMELMNEYDSGCEGMLEATEQSVYVSLVLIWNRLRRPEWFSVSRTELMRKAGIKGQHRLERAQESLEQKGFIKTTKRARTAMRMYRLEPLPTRAEMAQGARAETAITRAEMAQTENTLEPKQLKSLSQNGPNLEPQRLISQSKSNRDISTTVVEISNSNLESIPSEVLKTYREEIRPVESPMDLMRMKELSEEHGADLVVKAIQRAAIRGKRSMGYVEAILRSWKQNGYDDEPEEGGAHGKRRTKQPARRLTPEEEQAKWEREAENQRRFREAQRRELGAGWDL